MNKKKLIKTIVIIIILIGIIAVGHTQLMPKSKEQVKEEIDGIFEDSVGTTYYGGWVITPEEVNDLKSNITEQLKDFAESQNTTYEPVSELEWLEFHIDYLRMCTNWGNLYERGVFDCSEMSAFMECYLEHWGYKAYICGSSKFLHAWVHVEINGKTIPIESTGMYIVPETDLKTPTYDDYLQNYEQKFKDIHEATVYNEDDYDWWNNPSYKGLGKLTFDEEKTDDYILSWCMDQIGEINMKPTASFTCSEYTIEVYDSITFDASESWDTGEIVEYEWFVDDEYEFTGKVFECAFVEIGNFTVTLVVTDDEGATDTTSEVICVEPIDEEE